MKNQQPNKMKNIINRTLLFVLLGLFLTSCEKSINTFDNSQNFIYFDMPFQVDQYGIITKKRVDSLSFSFAMSDISVTTYIFKIPVSIVGLANEKSRLYKVILDQEKSNITENDWSIESIENLSIQSGYLHDTIQLEVNRTPDLKTSWKSLTLRIIDNENFKVGAEELITAKISFTDILQPPTWWNSWISIFGEFSREKYLKWQEIYYLGADPNLESFGPDTGKQLYWDQMPYYVVSSWYPSTWMFIRMLKKYFDENEVYPDGDTSKPRILLP